MSNMSTRRKAWALLNARERRHAWIILCIIIVSALSTAAMVGSVIPFLSVLADPEKIRSVPLLAWGYEAGGFTSDYSFVVALAFGSLGIIIVSNLLMVARSWAVARFAEMRVHTLSSRLLAAYLKQPYEYFLNHHSGEMSTQILSESQEVVNRFIKPAGELIASAITVVAVVGVLVLVNPTVAIISFAVFGSLYGGTYLISRRTVDRYGRARAEANRARFKLANEALAGVKDIKLMCREGVYVDRFQPPSIRMARAVVAVSVIGQVPNYVMQAVAFGGVIILCLALLDPADLASGAAIGEILPLIGVFAFGGQRLLPELSRIYAGLTLLNSGGAAVDAIYTDLTSLADPGNLATPLPKPLGLKSELHLEKVSYIYPEADQAGIRDVTLTITVGEKIGIVGTTGAGKTTLADVILGLLRPNSGNLVADGTEVTEDNLRAWLQTVGYVPQDIFLSDASMAENIALGLTPEEINFEQLHCAARIAKIHQFITDEMPQGYNTLVGERGVRLSGGQRQRIGIARALYNEADLIIFDEATSSLDNLTERDVMAAIEMLPGDKTVMMIAHRLSTVRRCDRIAVMDRGALVDIGTWDELMLRCETFRNIAELA